MYNSVSSNNVYLSIFASTLSLSDEIEYFKIQLEFSDVRVNECFHRMLKVSTETTQLGIVLINVRVFPLGSSLHPTQTRKLKIYSRDENGA